MQLTSVNIAQLAKVGEFKTGIMKIPQQGSCHVSKSGVDGDHIHHKSDHGGSDQAIYCYGGDDYAWWQSELGYELNPGTFGENLTIQGLSCKTVHIGDQLTIGDVVLEATAPRIPCAILGAKMEDPRFPVAFRRAERPGFYCRVLKEGQLEKGMPVIYASNDQDQKLQLLDLFRLAYDPNPVRETLEKTLHFPIAIRERNRIEKLIHSMA
ncbi:MAG: MOSC domain-containing protein [Gammaproteobacteria bacterium]|nr:MOSC domain-containing protein [Gammaproteobacteria bacterium]